MRDYLCFDESTEKEEQRFWQRNRIQSEWFKGCPPTLSGKYRQPNIGSQVWFSYGFLKSAQKENVEFLKKSVITPILMNCGMSSTWKLS